jgi:hypothetical protein
VLSHATIKHGCPPLISSPHGDTPALSCFTSALLD